MKQRKIIYQIKSSKPLVIRMPTELGRRIDEYSENFNMELENIKKTQSEMKNSGLPWWRSG